MITPVENGKIWLALQPSKPASAAQQVRASIKPCSPVPALALPVLTSSARIPPGDERCSRATVTGAAQKRFLVNTPATLAPSHNCITNKSLRFSLLMFASATPNEIPATGNSSDATGVVRLTGINQFQHGDRNRSEQAGIGEARSTGTGVYLTVHEDAEHRATPIAACAVDLCRHV